MRTTLTVDDQLLAELRERAHREGVPLKEMVNRALRQGLEAMRRPPRRRPSQTTTYAMGEPRLPTLDRGLAIADALEDEEIARELALRK